MVNRVRRVVGQSREDVATVPTTGQRWESLRAKFRGGLKRTELALECSHRANEYQAALTFHLNNQGKD